MKKVSPSINSHPSDERDLKGRHVIVLNWKDDQHPQSGGAETYCHAFAERFVRRGATVYLLTARAPGQSRKDRRGGVEIRRMGGTYTVYPLVLLRLLIWRLFARRRLDLLVDCQNGIPFFSPLVVSGRTTVVMLIFHVHQDQFEHYLSPIAARFGRWLEGPLSRIVYRQRTIAVISPSTREQVRNRLKLGGALFVVPCGSELPTPNVSLRSSFPSVVCVGRMVPHKRIHLLLESLPTVINYHPHIHVDLVGEGPSRRELEILASELGVDQHVTFHGHVSASRRDALASNSWLAVNPSLGEGWGLSIIEANAGGRPAVCFDVDGLRDAVRDGLTGWVSDHPENFAETIVKALNTLSDESEAARWSSRAQAWAASFSWDDTAFKLSNVLLTESDRLARRKTLRERNDLALRITVKGGNFENTRRGRRTDVWRQEPEFLIGLLYGLDERDVEVALARLDVGELVDVRVARGEDLLIAPSSKEQDYTSYRSFDVRKTLKPDTDK